MIKKPSSVIKWTGSKRKIAKAIFSLFPEANRYFEPFLGGGALLYLASYKYQDLFANDIYQPLIDFWTQLQKNPVEVIESYRKNWLKLQEDFPDYYYVVRNRFNKKPNGNDLLFLSRTCTNGIIRFNKNGEFNNSLHVTRKGMNPELFERIVLEWYNVIKKVEFTCEDFFLLKSIMKKNDFVYLDPPYLNSKNRYFSNLDYNRLLEFLEELNSKDVKWILSFDGRRGKTDLTVDLPKDIYKKHIYIDTGNSTIKQVLSSCNEKVIESLYLNY